MGGPGPPIHFAPTMHLVRARKLLIAAAVAGTALTGVPATAPAATAPPVVVSLTQASGSRASYFQVTGRPGRTISAGKLIIRNRTHRRVRVFVDRVDALTATTLGSAYKVRGLAIHGPTRWTRLSPKRVVVGPRGRVTVRVRVRVRRGARPGDYLSGIGVQTSGKRKVSKVRTNVAVSSVQRYVVGLEVKLPGRRRPHVVLSGARVERQPSGVVFQLHARNTGNVILEGVKGSIRVSRDGRTVARVPILPGTFVTGTAIDYPAPARREQPRAGTEYRVKATMVYPGGTAKLDRTVRFGKVAARTQERFGGPKVDSGSSGWWLWLVVVAAALGALAGAYRLGARRTG
jgi:hypothetical protein